MEKLTPQEEEAMMAVWKAGEGNVKIFLDNIEEPRPPYTTLECTLDSRQEIQ